MGKIAIDKRKEGQYLVYRLSFPETINDRVFRALEIGSYEGMCPLVLTKTKKASSLEYKITGETSLAEHLHTPTSKDEFLAVVLKLIRLLKLWRSQKLNLNNVELALDRMYFDRESGAVKCIYWPVVNHQSDTTVLQFFKELPNSTTFFEEGYGSFIKQYNDYFRTLDPFSLNNFEGFIFSLKQFPKEAAIVEPVLQKNDPTISDPSNDPIEYDPFTWLDRFNRNNSAGVVCRAELKQKLPEYRKEGLRVVLVREATGERIAIKKSPFRVGKSSHDCDYQITGNNAISRVHAEIVIKENKAYLADLYSKNKTFIDGELVTPNTQMELAPGQTVKFANERFFVEIK